MKKGEWNIIGNTDSKIAVIAVNGLVILRDMSLPDFIIHGTDFVFTPNQWRDFRKAIQNGELDVEE